MNGLDGANRSNSTGSSASPKKSALKKSNSPEKEVNSVAQNVLKRSVTMKPQADYHQIKSDGTSEDHKINMPTPPIVEGGDINYIRDRVNELKEEVSEGRMLSEKDLHFLETGEALLAQPRESITNIPVHLRKEDQVFKDKLNLPGVSLSKKPVSTQKHDLSEDVKRQMDLDLIKTFERLDSKNNLYANREIIIADMFSNQPKKTQPITMEELRELYKSYSNKNENRIQWLETGEVKDKEIISTLSRELNADIDIAKNEISYLTYSEIDLAVYVRKAISLQEKIVEFMINKSKMS